MKTIKRVVWAIVNKEKGSLLYCGLLKEDMPKPVKGKYVKCHLVYEFSPHVSANHLKDDVENNIKNKIK